MSGQDRSGLIADSSAMRPAHAAGLLRALGSGGLISLAFILAGIAAVSASIGWVAVTHRSTSIGNKQLLLFALGMAGILGGTIALRIVRVMRAQRISSGIGLSIPVPGLGAVGCFFGLCAGLTQSLDFGVRKALYGDILLAGPAVLWMVPMLDACAIAGLGWACERLVQRQPFGFRRSHGVGLVASVACFSVLLLLPNISRGATALLALGAGTQIARLASAHPHGFDALVLFVVGWPGLLNIRLPGRRAAPTLSGSGPSRRDFLVGAAASLGALAVGVRGTRSLQEQLLVLGRPSPRSRAPSLLVVVMDTVRAQSLSLYGYDRPTTPFLSKLARSGVRFDTAISTAPWTLPSHASLFTGRLPHELSVGWFAPLDGEAPTLADVLASRGYATGGFVANAKYCSYEFGLQRGFQHYSDYTASPGEAVRTSTLGSVAVDAISPLFAKELGRRSATDINADVLDWLSGVANRPYFAFLNYFDGHDPYLASSQEMVAFAGIPHPLNHVDYRRPPWSADEMRQMRSAYEASIASMDGALERLIGEMSRRGHLEDTLVIITSDHGEEFDEHGQVGHGHDLYLDQLHVPLVLSFPGHVPGGLRVDEPVSLRDVPATAMRLLGQDGVYGFPGAALTRYWEPDLPGRDSGPLVSEVQVPLPGVFPTSYPAMLGPMRSVISDGLQYIRNYGNGAEELYQLSSYPSSKDDLTPADRSSSALQRLRDMADALPPMQA